MKKIRIVGLIVVVALLLMVGCAQKTYKEGSQVAASIQDVAQEARVGKQQVSGTVTRLDNMFNNPKGDLKKQFEAYSKSIDELEVQAKRVNDRVNTMTSKKADYLEQWDIQMASIESETVRQTAEQRKQKVEEMFTDVQRDMKAAGEAYQPFISKLNDIRTAVNMDLNRNGLNAMLPIAEKAKADAMAINTRLDGAISTLHQAAEALTKK